MEAIAVHVKLSEERYSSWSLPMSNLGQPLPLPSLATTGTWYAVGMSEDCRLSMCTSHCCDNDCKIPSSCVIVVTYSLTTWSSVALKWTLGDDVRISLISVKLLTLSCRRSKTKSLNSSLAPSISLPRLQKWPKLTKETLPSPNYFSHFSVWTHVAIKLGIIISKCLEVR